MTREITLCAQCGKATGSVFVYDHLLPFCSIECAETRFPTRTRETSHAMRVRSALVAARDALDSAVRTGRRADCLRHAVADLEGALRNVEMEDAARSTAPEEKG